MQVIIAPSKTMTMTRPFPVEVVVSSPQLLSEAIQIVGAIRKTKDLTMLMHISKDLAEGVVSKYDSWGEQKEPCIFAYVGDVYKGFFADTLSAADLEWAQQHLFIMSGLYGILRPMDEISPYRLEMKTRLSVNGHRDLYSFWGKKITKIVDESPDEIVCNLASDEYARPVTMYTTKRIVTPVFVDKKANGTVGAVPIYSKMMRGVMARWIIDHRVSRPEELENFKAQGYSFDDQRSTENYPTFYRGMPEPIRF